MMEQSTFQPGDICLECKQLGFRHHLRTFYIDINEQIVKCESSECLYPYENDFSDSDEEQSTTGDKSYLTELNSMTSYDGYDDADSVRFVDAVLCCGNSNTAEKSDVLKVAARNSTQTESFVTPISLDNYSGNKSEDVAPSLYTRSESDQTEGVGFIDVLLSNCKSETSRSHCPNEFENKPTMSLHDMPVLNFDFSNTQLKMEPPPQPMVKKRSKPPIEIQCIQTVKAGFSDIQNEYSITNTPKVAINSLKLIKTEYVKPVLSDQIATETTSETKETSAENGGNKVRISRYFDALRINQEKLQKTRTKPTSLKRRKHQQKLNIGAGSSLINVLQVLKNRSE